MSADTHVNCMPSRSSNDFCSLMQMPVLMVHSWGTFSAGYLVLMWLF